LDPVAIHLIAVFAVGGLCAVAYIWVLRILRRRTGQNEPKLTAIGARLLVAFVVVLGIAVAMRQFFPDTTLGAWLRAEGVMTNVVIASVAVLFAIEAVLKWLGLRTSEEEVQRDV
jgi:heme/copper-type cytochrome/quinol oxidase subunit 1